MFTNVLIAVLMVLMPRQAIANNECRLFSEIYKDGKQLCERMWNGAFKYEADPTKPAMDMWFFDDHNPNDNITKRLGLPSLATVGTLLRNLSALTLLLHR